MTPDFLLMGDFHYDSYSQTLTHEPTGNQYSNYYGISRIATFRQDRIQTSLERTYGRTRAADIKRKSVLRGNHLHKIVRLSSLDVNLGVSLAKEIFVFGHIIPDAPAIQGSIDEISYDPNVGFTLIEYKSKSSIGAWKKYESSLLPIYKRKLAVYRYLMWSFYKVNICRVCLIILLPDMSHELIEIPVNELRMPFNDFEVLYRQFLKTVQ